MADNKHSFILYTDQRGIFNNLSDEEAGRLIKHIYSYVCDENPEPIDRITQISFEPIKNTLKRDLKKWEKEQQERSIYAIIGNLKRWHEDLYKLYLDGKKSLSECEEIVKKRKLSPPDTPRYVPDINTSTPDGTQSPPIANIAVSVNDIVTVSDKKEIYKEKSNSDNFNSRYPITDELKAIIEEYGRPDTVTSEIVYHWNMMDITKKHLFKQGLERYKKYQPDPKFRVKLKTFISEEMYLRDFKTEPTKTGDKNKPTTSLSGPKRQY